MAGKLQGAMYALRQCVSCGERLWVLDGEGTCADCGGRSRPTITQFDIDRDTETAHASVQAIAPIVIQSIEQCAQFLSAFNEVKSKYGRYTAFEKYGVERCEYTRVRDAYLALGKLLHAKLTQWYDATPAAL